MAAEWGDAPNTVQARKISLPLPTKRLNLCIPQGVRDLAAEEVDGDVVWDYKTVSEEVDQR